jgi:class 3 adenylate cyclase/predicted ATPase
MTLGASGDFDQVLQEVTNILLQHGRVTYRGLKRRFGVDDEYIEDIKAELIDGRGIAFDEAGKVLVRADSAGAERPAGSTTPEAFSETAERRQLTIMFCDLVNSTELSARLDPEDYRELIVRYHEVCGQAVLRYGGHVAQYLGDGLQIYFGYPRAHDDSVTRAVHAALEILRQLPSQTASETDAPAALAVRIGIHTGLVVVGAVGTPADHSERLALGETPNVAARVQALATPNSVVITASSRALLRETFELISLGAHVLRGIARPVELFRVIGTHASARVSEPAGALSIVGRTADLALLQARFDSALSGVGQIVAISGEPGIGKSCLIRAFRWRLGGAAWQWECRCAAYHAGGVLQPIADLLRRTFAIEDHDDQADAREKLRLGLAARQQPEEAFERFSALLSLGGKLSKAVTRSPRLHRRRTIELLSSFLLARAEQQPVVLVIEDLHWADPTTLEFLATLSIQARATRSLLLVSHRPGFHPGWGPDHQTTTVTLDRLGGGEARALVRDVLGGRPLSAALIDELLEKTDGMPLYIEELTRMLLDSSDPATAVGIPSSITDSLMARLDQLGPAREVAQIGAVLGRSFRYELLAAIWQHDEPSLRDHLASVVRSGLLLQRGFPPDALYTFKHALVQEAASATLLRRDSKLIHERAGRALIDILPQLSAAYPERVASHFSEARRAEQALQYWELAADKALETAANIEAVRHLYKAIEVLNELPTSNLRDQRELALLVKLRVPLTASQGYASKELARVCERAHSLCARAGTPLEHWSVLLGLWYHYEVSGEFRTADRIVDELERVAIGCATGEVELQMEIVRGHEFWRGRFQEARVHFEHIRRSYELQGHPADLLRFDADPLVLALCYLHAIDVITDQPLPEPTAAALAIAHAKQIGHAYSLAFAFGFAGACAALSDDRARVAEYASEVIALSKEHGFALWLAEGEILQGWAEATELGLERALERLQRGLELWEATGARLWHTHQLAMQTELLLTLGHTREAAHVLERAERLAADGGEQFLAPELLRLRGELALLDEPDQNTAREIFESALELAQTQGAGLFERKVRASLLQLQSSPQPSATSQIRPRSLARRS